ncbi:MAG: hypothetical protein IIA87_02605 [Nanoarchaeota archaeon]|nr:hypothetical protein [Nanoarchaeota archaeon]
MRNSYLAFVLSKYEQIKNEKERIFIDEFSFQSLFMILQNKSSEENIQKIIRKLPKSDILFVFEANREKRHKAYKKLHPYKKGAILLPASWIDKSYAKSLMEVMEYNFEIIKKIILKNYNEDKEAVSEINKIKLPKEYKRDIKISVYRK